MALLNGLPVYQIQIKDDPEDKTGMDFISCVTHPAIETNWVAMADKKPLKFKFDADRQILYGPILIPDKPIYRYDEVSGLEYYVTFTKAVIEKMIRKFQSQRKTVNINYQHQKDSQVKSAVVQEIWLTGKGDKSKDLGFELPEGSGFVGVYIGDQKFWNEEIKSGNVLGFSIEGWLDMEMKKIKQQYMDKFISAKTDTGMEIKCDGESFANGAEVYTEVDGNKTPVPDGEYMLENGMKMTVAGGKITDMADAPTEEEAAEAIIQEAIKPQVDALKAEMKKQAEVYEARIKEMETRLANMPGAQSATSKTDEKDKPLTPKQKLAVKLSILRKKTGEVEKKK